MSKKIKIAILILLIGTLIFVVLTFFKTSEEIKKYDNPELSFEYSGRYELEIKDNYLELTEKNSNIIFEIRKLTSVENNASFDSLVDNIIYNYQKQSPTSVLVSEYSDYKFTNGLSGYRIVFENNPENLNTLMLITLDNLNFTIITLNAYQEEFEFLTDSAELIMNTLTFKKGYEYLTVSTKYPNVQVLTLESKGQEDLEFSSETRRYSRNSSSYKYSVDIPVEFKPTVDSDGMLTVKSSDQTTISYMMSSLDFKYDAERDYDAKYYENYKVLHGYAKYNDEVYYVIKKQYSSYGKWREVVEISDLVDYASTLQITISSYKHISDEQISKILMEIEVEPLTDGKLRVEDNKIISTLTQIEKNYDLPNLIGNNVIQVDYDLENNNCVTYSDMDSSKMFFCADANIELDILSTSSSFNEESMQKYDGYSNYKYNLISTKNINGNQFKHYKETYTYKSLYSTRDYEHHYFVLRINSKYNFIVTTNTELSEERINDLLDVKITQYKYQIG